MLKPNTHRVLIQPIELKGITTSSGIVLPGQQKPGENLLYGMVVDPGDTEFKEGQEVFYSEYSSAAVIDARKMLAGEQGVTKNPLVIVSDDDIMAYYKDVRNKEEVLKALDRDTFYIKGAKKNDALEVSEIIKKD